MPKPITNQRLLVLLLSALSLLAAGLSACNSAPPPTTSSPAPAAAVATPDPCAAVTDAAIIKEVADKIKADPQFSTQLKHIAVNSKDRVVWLLGWAKGDAAVATLGQYASAAKCVSKVNNQLNPRLTVGCGNDQENCPGVGCVPIGQCVPPVGREASPSGGGSGNN